MSKLYLYNYNNYFNRIVKRETSLANYGTPIYSLTATNFNYNDGVETYHDINYAGFDGNYLIVTDDNDNIVSRWFIKENKRLRGGQHRITLRRDLIVDNYDKIINAPALINRAMLSKDNPLLFNSEGFSFNQIKKEEILLKDRLGKRWYILYFKKGTGNITGSIATGETTPDITISTTIENSIYATGERKFLNNAMFGIIGVTNYFWLSSWQQYIRYKQYKGYYQADTFMSNPMRKYLYFDDEFDIVENGLKNVFDNLTTYNQMYSYLQTELSFTNNVTEANTQQLLAANGKIVKDSSNTLYFITVSKTTEEVHADTRTNPDSSLTTYMKGKIDESALPKTGDYGDSAFYYNATKETYNVTATEITTGTLNYTLDFASKINTNDSDYNIIALPYDEVNIYSPITPVGPNSVSGEISKLLIDNISIKAGSNLVDIQILPYAPLIDLVNDTIIDLRNLAGKQYSYLYTSTTVDDETTYSNFGLILYIKTSNYTFDINNPISIIRDSNLSEAINLKLSNECDVYRLCSPNYNGIFEFSVAKNNGVDKFNVDITLIPYNPYIHINPNFKGLYGDDFNDSRGLILGGDFSLPKVSTEWAEYQLRNKNYQQAFERQMEHMDFEFSKQRTEALFGATMGALGGAMSGAVGGSVIGGTGGAGVGGLLGGVASAVGGAIDYNILKERQAEQKDLTLDMFEYQLGNIKARPYNINKVTPLTYNNKQFPFIERYSCTDTERQMLINKIRYNSMKVNNIGSIQEYLQAEKTYISASLIRLEDLDMPTHEANEIYDEILKGVYI